MDDDDEPEAENGEFEGDDEENNLNVEFLSLKVTFPALYWM